MEPEVDTTWLIFLKHPGGRGEDRGQGQKQLQERRWVGDQARTEEYWTGAVNGGLLAAGFRCISKVEPMGFAGISCGLREREVSRMKPRTLA